MIALKAKPKSTKNGPIMSNITNKAEMTVRNQKLARLANRADRLVITVKAVSADKAVR